MTLPPFVVLHAGQSNAIGRNSCGADWSGIDPNVFVWNAPEAGCVSGQPGTAFVRAICGKPPFIDSSNNSGVWLASRIAAHSGRPVYYVLVAAGSRPIVDWTAGSTPMMAFSQAVWNAAHAAAPLPPAPVFLWQQGESDVADADRIAYPARYGQMLAAFQTRQIVATNAIVLMSELAATRPGSPEFNLMLAGLVPGPRAALVAAADLDTSDGTHFTGPALAPLLADRCYDKWLEVASR